MSWACAPHTAGQWWAFSLYFFLSVSLLILDFWLGRSEKIKASSLIELALLLAGLIAQYEWRKNGNEPNSSSGGDQSRR